MNNGIIGRRIKELRKNNNMTQQELADVVGISFTGIAHWESGNSKPDAFQIGKIADYFNVSIDYICGRENDDLENQLKSDKELRILFRKATELEDDKKNKLNSILKASINALWDEKDDSEL